MPHMHACAIAIGPWLGSMHDDVCGKIKLRSAAQGLAQNFLLEAKLRCVVDVLIMTAAAAAKVWAFGLHALRRRRKHAIESGAGRKRLGFTIYGPRGEVLREWTTDEDQDGGEGRPGSTP